MFNLENFLNNSNTKNVLKQAQNLSSGVSSLGQAKQVLNRVGVNFDSIRKTRNLLNNPLAGSIAKRFNVNLDSLKQGIDVLLGDYKNQSPPANSQYRNSTPSLPKSAVKTNIDKLRDAYKKL